MESERINLAGTRIVFEASVAAARVKRLVYTSSAAAYGYYSDNPDPITEDVPPRGSPEHDYSAQKAACEAALTEITDGTSLEVFVLRPCIVAGPKATALADSMPWNRLPSRFRAITRAILLLKLPLPRAGNYTVRAVVQVAGDFQSRTGIIRFSQLVPADTSASRTGRGWRRVEKATLK